MRNTGAETLGSENGNGIKVGAIYQNQKKKVVKLLASEKSRYRLHVFLKALDAIRGQL